MELRIRSTDLYAASVALSACSDQLNEAAVTFVRRGLAELPGVGAAAGAAAQRGIIQAEQATQVMSTDIERLARALAALAQHYPRVDATAVPGR